jgi:hypothetical protein
MSPQGKATTVSIREICFGATTARQAAGRGYIIVVGFSKNSQLYHRCIVALWSRYEEHHVHIPQRGRSE